MELFKKIRGERPIPIKNPSRTQQEWYPRRNNFSLGNPYPTFKLKQKEFNRPKPEREYRRFPETKIAFSGIDPSGKIQEFINKDIIRPLTRPSLYESFNIKNPNFQHNKLYKTRINDNAKWALSTSCRAPNYESLPKVQPFKNYYFPPKYNNKDIDKYRNYSLKSDNISIKVPKIKKIEPKNSFLKLKRDYSVSSETKFEHRWRPCPITKNSIINISSKDYNIINFMPLFPNENNSEIMNKTLNYRKKGMGEYKDLTKTFRVNINNDFVQKFNENPKRFYKYTGIFSNMYDASHKNGNIITPFGKKVYNES